MIVIVDDRDAVLDAYRGMFSRIGYSVFGMNSLEVEDWLESSTSDELESIQSFLIGKTNDEDRLINALRARTRVPIIAMLETGSLDETLQRFDIGADDVVRKPVHVREILARISAIRRRAQDSKTYIDCGRLRVFMDGRDPLIDGKPFPLPRRERRVLEYLAGNGERRASRTQVYNAVYGVLEEHVEECVIESHISKLRKKLTKALGVNVIDSRRYLGYRLDIEALRAAGRAAEIVEQPRASLAV
ncbi:response regulator transcription factor [Roseitalea porphyridii]|uniref:Response regulator transcription factor n=1 Tax=Roseitalea porphyridii TaxID=1852022 RepID=A0A4P6V1H3_9HYPH|nr:response regulator transcription factor [Roseitalea porphyridii]QBK30499.1 response regulator transcription factor [Roseitalea porphyridii]